MQVQGKVVKVLDAVRFQTKNGEGVRHQFVIETNDRYPKTIIMDILGDDKWTQWGNTLISGAELTVDFDLSSREWNGKWFTSCTVWNVTSNAAPQQQA